MAANEDIDAHILTKFEVIQKLGKGAYGIVWKVREKETNEIVALKKYLGPSKMPPTHKGHLGKLFFSKNWANMTTSLNFLMS